MQPSSASAPALITEPPDFTVAAPGLPSWWQAGQKDAWQRFTELPMPSRKDEGWRFTDLAKVRLEGFRVGLPVNKADQDEIRRIAEKSSQSKPTAGGLAFANDHLIHQLSLSVEWQNQGVIFCTLSDALKNHADLVQKYFMAHETNLGAAKFSSLHRAHCRDGLFLYLPRGVSLNQPLEIFYWITSSEAAIFPHNLVIAEANSRAEVRFYYQSTDAAQGGLVCSTSDFYTGAGAQLRNIHVQDLSEKANSYQFGSTTVERDAHALSLHLNLGAAYARLENKSRLVGQGSRSDMLSLTAGHARQEFDQRTFQEHVVANTVSDLLYKNALADDSRTIFAGMIAVDPHAQQTNAYQSNRNLLLSESAEANSLPGLEIMANDVRCTHGATSGQISPEELFYLLQRGIPLNVARKLFVLGFFDEVLGRLHDTKLSEELHARVEMKFAAKIVT